MKLLDTTFLIHYYFDTPGATRYKEDHDYEFRTLSINVKEFLVAHTLEKDSPMMMSDFQQEFGFLQIEPYRKQFSFEAAQIEANLRNNGEYKYKCEEDSSFPADILIGGAARDLQSDIVTRNIGDYDIMPSVSVDQY